ncbi:hypothetical protein CEXT_814521 [Caerostris extrusa]|uniref:Uncharacterized protein n=1 Tax=Caerostris extrusa TaxID=172846 RepID=A0AAV4MHY6_CAEEX|nr:hypothetical protein CEXT_814521 [Caerostris extrusa]
MRLNIELVVLSLPPSSPSGAMFFYECFPSHKPIRIGPRRSRSLPELKEQRSQVEWPCLSLARGEGQRCRRWRAIARNCNFFCSQMPVLREVELDNFPDVLKILINIRNC